ncbi:hypothetical protein [Klebsiella pneumoniae]|uniref:hypothetical protein n=1 Tax=Klebsiella pneumoniae TaxID=573 RepID=UPI0024057BDF|nr:hypothetical protein [Klebsiella pneumoniae]MDG0253187.1 hypothetical protein [Klebsiella pneumoniae]
MTGRELAGLKAIELWENGAFDADMILMVLGKRMGMSSSAELVHWLSSQGTIRGSQSKEKINENRHKAAALWISGLYSAPELLEMFKGRLGIQRKESLLFWFRQNGYVRNSESPDAPKNPRAILRERAVELRKAGQHTTRQIFDELSPELGMKNVGALRRWFKKNGIVPEHPRKPREKPPKPKPVNPRAQLRAVCTDMWASGEYTGKDIRSQMGEKFPFASLGAMYGHFSKVGVRKGSKESD